MIDPSEFIEVVKNRHCMRSFLDREVDRQILDVVLESATHAASSKNSQPWQVKVLSGDVCRALSAKLCGLFDEGVVEQPDYVYMTEPMPDIFKQRARSCGYGLFDLKGIKKDDYEARKLHNRENFEFFGAPVMMLFHLHEGAQSGNFMDLGLFLQNVMLGLVAYGLGSCPQFSLTSYSKCIKSWVGIDQKRVFVCGLSVGYPDVSAEVNCYIPSRVPLSEVVDWVEALSE